MKHFTILFSLIFLNTAVVLAHGPIHESIKRVTKKIKKDPNNAALYLERGQYYQVDENFDLALNDFTTVRRLDPNNKLVDYQCGKLFAEHEFPTMAKRYADQFLSYNSEHVAGLMLRASIFVQLGKDSLAIIDYEKGIKKTNTPKPEYFIDISKAFIAADSTNFDAAIEWLEKGEEYLGFNITLKSYAYDLAKRMKQYDKAAEITENVLIKMNRKETWLYKKAVVLELAEDYQSAQDTYQETIDHIKKLPVRFQKTKMMLELEGKTRLALMRLK